MVETYSLVLQSPSFDGTGGNGEQLPLPGIQWSNAATSNSNRMSLGGNTSIEFSFGKITETITIQGVFTDANISGENWRWDPNADGGSGAWETYQDALHARDVLQRSRKAWESEEAPATGQNSSWDDTGLPSEERDSGTDRSGGYVRLVLDKTYLTSHYEGTIPSRGSSLSRQFAFAYGSIDGYSEKHVGASHRYRIPYQIDFNPVQKKFAFTGVLS